MQLTKVSDFNDWQKRSASHKRHFLLFTKEGSANGSCAEGHLAGIEGDFPVFVVDVARTRDIHPRLGVTSIPTLVVMEDGKVRNMIKGCQSPAYYEKVLRGEGSGIRRQEAKPQKRVTVYSTPSCPYCNKLKQYLNKHGIRYTDINVAANKQAADEMVRRSGQRGVPQTDINGKIIIGFDVPKISRMLDIPTE